MGNAITIFLPLSLIVMMFSLGLGLTVEDFTRVVRQPKAFFVGLGAQFVLLPVIAFAICGFFNLSPAMSVGLMILSLCPGGPTSNVMTRFAKGDVALSISINGISNLAAVLTVPVFVAYFVGHFLGDEAPTVHVAGLGLRMFALTTVPVIAGMLTMHYLPRIAAVIDRPLRALTALVLIIIVSGALLGNWGVFIANLPSLGPSVIALGLSVLAASLALAWICGLGQGQTTAIAMDATVQNAALGIAIGALVAGVVAQVPVYSIPSGVYGVAMYLMAIPVMFWRRGIARRHSAAMVAVA